MSRHVVVILLIGWTLSSFIFWGRLLFITTDGNQAISSLRRNDVSQRGVLYFAYHVDQAKAKKTLERVYASAESLRLHNPGLRIAIATNVQNLSIYNLTVVHGITDIIQISHQDVLEGPPGKAGRQWWTRTLYLSKSPYELTLQLDSDRTVCSDISNIFAWLSEYDFVGVSAGILPAFDNGVMAWKRNNYVSNLFEVWLEELIATGKIGNDQPPLARAIKRVHGLKVGVMSPIYQAKLIPARGEVWGMAKAARTLVLRGSVRVVAGGHKSCEIMNRGSPNPRIILSDYDGSYRVAFSEAECEHFLNKTRRNMIGMRNLIFCQDKSISNSTANSNGSPTINLL